VPINTRVASVTVHQRTALYFLCLFANRTAGKVPEIQARRQMLFSASEEAQDH